MTDLTSFLAQLGLSNYEAALRSYGVEDAADVAALVDEDYDAIGAVKPFHRKKMANHAAQLLAARCVFPSFLAFFSRFFSRSSS